MSSARNGTRGRAAYRPPGFTLIEMLVVLLIIGLLAGAVGAVAWPTEQDTLRLEAERLAQLIDLAGAQARLTGRPLAWTCDGKAYRFWRYDAGAGWLEIRDNDLHARALPAGVSVSDVQLESGPALETMRLQFSPYGEDLAFVIHLALDQQAITVAGSPVGEVRIEPGRQRPGSEPAASLAPGGLALR